MLDTSPYKTVSKALQAGYWWPTMFRDAHRFVSKCDVCQRQGNISKRNEMPQNFILEVEWVEALASPTNDAKVVMKMFKSVIFPRFGVPRVVISDGGSHFINITFDNMLKRHGVKHKVATPYHPQTSGQVSYLTEKSRTLLIPTSQRGNLFLLVIHLLPNGHSSQASDLNQAFGGRQPTRNGSTRPQIDPPIWSTRSTRPTRPLYTPTRPPTAGTHQVSDFRIVGNKKKKFLRDIRRYFWDEPYLYKHYTDGVYRRCVADEEIPGILFHCHSSSYAGPFATYKTVSKAMQAGYWWPNMFRNAQSPTNDGKVVMKMFKSVIIPRFGVLRVVISVGGSHFINRTFDNMLKRHGVKHKVATPYHPQTSGQVELSNREIKNFADTDITERESVPLSDPSPA
ncbi:unnamed protein product [Microthlaspi erraticum]|uniref:Integrase catalytic domain-containing protein n=1 Tax=Microthlaspi erraticum TaxID=1685480 RepID=A0A6D2J667_9BRAS|nr:unnamed protein product [Microthlaspi erraticum]